MAESDEYWSYLMASAYALVGEEDQALGWLEHAVTVRGWIDYVYFTRHDRFLESVRGNRRFQELMAWRRSGTRGSRTTAPLPCPAVESPGPDRMCS